MIRTVVAIGVLALAAAHSQEDSRLKAGLGAYWKRDYTRAAAELGAALEGGGDTAAHRQAVAALGLSFYHLGQFSRAIAFLEKAGEWAADNVELSYVLGMCYLKQPDAAAARRAFARMFNVPPDSARAHLITAQFQIRERLEPQAEEELKQAQAKDPNLPHLHFLAGELAVYRGEVDRGIAELEKEIALNPGHAMAHYRLGDAHTRKDQWQQAVAPLQKSIWLNPNFSSPYILLGKVYARLGQMEFAEGMLRRAVAMDPNNSLAHYQLAQVYRDTGRAELAKKHFDLSKRRAE